MKIPDSLVLVPTSKELDLVRKHLPDSLATGICGFGMIAAAIRATEMLADNRHGHVRHVVLLGIGGTFYPELIPVGAAASFGFVQCHGIGANSENGFLGPRDLDIPQLIDDRGNPCFDRLDLQSPGPVRAQGGLLTVASASGSEQDASWRARHYPECVCEDMEGFAVALAARQAGRDVSVIRGISNVTGDRDPNNWQIEAAMQSACDLLLRSIVDT